MVGYNIPLSQRWRIDLAAGIHSDISLARSFRGEFSDSYEHSSSFSNFILGTAQLNAGLSYSVNEKISVKITPQISYLLYSKSKTNLHFFSRSLWIGGQVGCYFHL